MRTDHPRWRVLALVARTALAAGLLLASGDGDADQLASEPTAPSSSAASTSSAGRPTAEAGEQPRPDWTARAEAAQARGDVRGAAQTRLDAAEAEAALGDYGRAVETLDRALEAATTGGADGATLAALRGARGNLYIVVARPEDARRELEAALALAREAGAAGTRATIANNLGNLHARTGEPALAVERYDEAAELALAIGDPALAARAIANAARADIEAGGRASAVERLARARSLIAALPPASRDKPTLLIHWARSLSRLVDTGEAPPIAGQAPALAMHSALLEAEALATKQADARSASYAWGYLGELYATEGRAAEALDLTQRAIERAREADAPEIRYAWHAQAAGLLAELGRREAAISEYAQAVALLEGLRHTLGVRYGARSKSFRDSVGGVYFGYVDLLLRRAAESEDAAADLALAQATLEQLKKAELRDYFRDECVDEARQSQVSVAQVSPSAAILYPVLLDDRIEILVTTAERTWRRSVPVPRQQATATLREFRERLEMRTTRQYLRPARTLHRWLIEPLLPELEAAGVDSLVFVPDGALRTVPMAALHDGERHLIERYAIALTPSLELTDPKPLDREHSRVFAGGVSEAVQGFTPLPHVREELAHVREAFGGEVVLDEAFQRDRIERDLRSESFNIVHIASHASFDPDAQDTFVLTHDGRLSMDDLASYVGLFRFREQPLDLLMLSACETAAGDERSALGLSGLAVKAGARSAVGTLWSVDDAATSRLVSFFYANLKDPDLTRAEALRRAQRALIEDPAFAHPAYWSAFILISNWL